MISPASLRRWAASLAALMLLLVSAAASAREPDLAFPAALAGFTRGERTDYESRAPGLGYSVRYSGPGWRVDVYVYDAGIAGIPDGPSSPEIAQQFAQAAADIQAAVRQGTYRQAVDTGPLTSEGADRVPCRTYSITRSDGELVDSILCLTGSRGKFVKFRLSSQGRASRQDAERFLASWRTRL